MTEFIITCQSELQKDGSYKIERYRELVRCKDCKNACVYDDNEVICTHIDSNGNDKHPADWFCADGERKEGCDE